MDFQKLVSQRRSHRKYSDDAVSEDELKLIVRAALMSPTSKGRRAWKFCVVRNKQQIEALAEAKEHGAAFLASASAAIVVLGDPHENDCWIEDGSIAAMSMQYQIEELKLGSCWIQIRGRERKDGKTACEVVRDILQIPQNLQVLCILAIGHPTDDKPEQDESNLKWESVL